MGFAFSREGRFVVASYMPRGFFVTMNFDTGDVPDELDFSTHTFAVLMHEVAHLAQDRTTIFGVLDFVHFYDSIWSIREYAERVPHNLPIPLPLNAQIVGGRLPEATKPCVIHQIETIREVTDRGEAWPQGDVNWAFESVSFETSCFQLGKQLIELPIATLHLVDNVSGDTYEHGLSAWEICEAYSTAVGLIHGDDEALPQSGFEYSVVERILQKEFGRVGPLEIIAACHWSLQNEAPAEALFRILQLLEEEFGHELPSADVLYARLRSDSLDHGYSERAALLCDKLDHIAAEHTSMNPDGNLAVLMSLYASETRRHLERNSDSGRVFPLDTLLCDDSRGLSPTERDQRMRQLFTELPVPMLVSFDEQTWTLGGDQHVEQAAFFIRSLKHLVDQIWSGHRAEWRCPLFGVCNLSIRDESCQATPWKRGELQPSCGYGGASKLLHISSRDFVV